MAGYLPGFGDEDDIMGDGLLPLHGPWREPLQFDEEEYLSKRASIATICSDKEIPYNLLVVGGIFTGKSSIINTFISALRNQICEVAFSSELGVSGGAVTTNYTQYNVQETVNRQAIDLKLCDTMGLQMDTFSICQEDIQYMIDGHIKDGYQFHPAQPIQPEDEYFNPNPGSKDKPDVIVMVIDAPQGDSFNPDLRGKLIQIADIARARNIELAVVLTKNDLFCPVVDNDITHIHRSSALQRLVSEMRDLFGLSQGSISCIQNYLAGSSDVNLAINILALEALQSILHLAERTRQRGHRCVSVNMERQPVLGLLNEPWREGDITEDALDEMTDALCTLQPKHVPTLRLCYLGPSGSGKSAFINSILSWLFQRHVMYAETGESNGTMPLTTQYREYRLQNGRDGKLLNVQLVDTMGFMPTAGGLLTDDISSILDGKMADKTSFNPRVPAIPHSDSIPLAPLADRMHLLAIVVNGAEFSKYPPQLIDKLTTALRLAKNPQADGAAIPSVVLVSHLDDLCRHVAEDPGAVYRSQGVRDCFLNISKQLRVPFVDVLPICNSHNDTRLDGRKSAIAMHALSGQVERAQDFLSLASASGKKKKSWFWFW